MAGRDKTPLVTGLTRQVSAVRQALQALPELDGVLVQPVLAFVDARLPLFGNLGIAGIPIRGLRGTARLVRQPGPLIAGQRHRLHQHLALRLPAYQR